MNWKKLRSPTLTITNAALANAKFQFSFCELGKKIEVSLKPIFKNLHFESKDELKNTMTQFEIHC